MKLDNAIYDRRSIKQFDNEACMAESDFLELIRRAMHAPTSFNIQHWRFVRITDSKLRERLRKVSFDQPKVTEASELLVITGDTKAWEKEPSRYWCNVDTSIALQMVAMSGDFYREKQDLQHDEVIRSCAFAAQNIMLSAGELGYGCCPMIGFDPEAVAHLIQLPEDHIVVMLLAIGKERETSRPRSGQLKLEDVLFENGFGS